MSDHVTRIHTLLESEREALLSGDFDRLNGLMLEKESMVAELEDAGLDQAALSSLQPKLERNQALFDRALAGLRAVTMRMATLSEVRKTLQTYDAAGRRQNIQNHQETKMERRA
jgi:hypothetical protein